MDIDHSQFSEREKEVIALLLQGKSNKQIAFELHIAQSTVEYHLKNIYQKLEVSSRTEAVLRLGKSVGNESLSEVTESTLETGSKASHHTGRPISMPKIPKNTLYRGIGILLIILLLITLFIPFNWTPQNAQITPPTSIKWDDQIVYILDVSKFYDANPTTVDGDLAGLLRQMRYLKGLGISTIVLENVLSPQDFQSIDPKVGTEQELTQFIDEAHSTANGPRINIILDVRLPVDDSSHMPVLNPTGGMDPGTGGYSEVRDAIFSLVDHFEIDGLRFPSADKVHPTFWSQFMSDFREKYGQSKPNFRHIAEVFVQNPGLWQIPVSEFVNQTSSVGTIRMDSVYDFATIAHIQAVFAGGVDPKCIPPFFCANLFSQLFPQEIERPEILMASVDSIFFSFLGQIPEEDVHADEKLYLASAFLFTINRVPLIYSGNEYAIQYTTQPGKTFARDLDEAFHEKYKNLIQIRRGYAAFRQGDLIVLNSDTVISYARKYEDETFIVVLNNNEVQDRLDLDLGSKGIACSSVRNLLVKNFLFWNDGNITLSNPGANEAILNVTMKPWEAKIIRCE